jgi:hypothetical protein
MGGLSRRCLLFSPLQATVLLFLVSPLLIFTFELLGVGPTLLLLLLLLTADKRPDGFTVSILVTSPVAVVIIADRFPLSQYVRSVYVRSESVRVALVCSDIFATAFCII